MQDVNLMTSMIDQCLEMIGRAEEPQMDQPKALQRRHLLWMCRRMREHVGDWPAERLNRWIGFVQAGMIANRMLDLDGAKAMFDRMKIAFGPAGEDLLDHLDPDSAFEFEIGGQG